MRKLKFDLQNIDCESWDHYIQSFGTLWNCYYMIAFQFSYCSQRHNYHQQRNANQLNIVSSAIVVPSLT